MAGSLRAVLAGIDRDLPFTKLRTMDDVVSASTSRERLGARLLGGFAAAALLLAVIGLYGVLAYAVTQRTAELGIRLALGARRDQVFVLVVQRGMIILATGIAIGLAIAFGATRLVRGLLFQVGPNDPLVFAVVTVSLAAAGVCAGVVPARRATMVDPVVALRSEQ
ncbi:MAG: FtsX-like permease family protein [Gemmatimonadota bacterium]